MIIQAADDFAYVSPVTSGYGEKDKVRRFPPDYGNNSVGGGATGQFNRRFSAAGVSAPTGPGDDPYNPPLPALNWNNLLWVPEWNGGTGGGAGGFAPSGAASASWIGSDTLGAGPFPNGDYHVQGLGYLTYNGPALPANLLISWTCLQENPPILGDAAFSVQWGYSQIAAPPPYVLPIGGVPWDGFPSQTGAASGPDSIVVNMNIPFVLADTLGVPRDFVVFIWFQVGAASGGSLAGSVNASGTFS